MDVSRQLPPAPRPGLAVTVTLDDLPGWLELHGLEIAWFDKDGRYFVQKKRESAIEKQGEKYDER